MSFSWSTLPFSIGFWFMLCLYFTPHHKPWRATIASNFLIDRPNDTIFHLQICTYRWSFRVNFFWLAEPKHRLIKRLWFFPSWMPSWVFLCYSRSLTYPSPSLYLLVADNFYRANRLPATPHPLQSHYYVNKFTLGDSLDKQKYISFIKSIICLV